ncbi:hypothetical protein SAMN05421869_11854 [Nonomuraea jiangxiensis]|uniref:IstB-like ATP-binding domain-containing protein n=1 Tax=Nonomuraea jiangxiensis TaxID=633440 RepID=A0A1G9E6J3_9ACTN|nr:hypothetical protein SAMN05421869_11854 [Nonomuraea jiangxiensis]
MRSPRHHPGGHCDTAQSASWDAIRFTSVSRRPGGGRGSTKAVQEAHVTAARPVRTRGRFPGTLLRDRLLHHCEVLAINGPSYRLKNRLATVDIHITATG